MFISTKPASLQTWWSNFIGILGNRHQLLHLIVLAFRSILSLHLLTLMTRLPNYVGQMRIKALLEALVG